MSNNEDIIYDSVIDFETMGIGCDAVVLDFSILFFNPKGNETFQELVDSVWRWKFDIPSQFKQGRTTTPSTMEWWKKQGAEAQEILRESEDDVTLDVFVKELYEHSREFVSDRSICYARGQDFDFPLLNHIIKNNSEHGQNFLCKFWNARDIRSYISGLMLNPSRGSFPVDEGLLSGFHKHKSDHDVAKAVIEMREARRFWKSTDDEV